MKIKIDGNDILFIPESKSDYYSIGSLHQIPHTLDIVIKDNDKSEIKALRMLKSRLIKHLFVTS